VFVGGRKRRGEFKGTIDYSRGVQKTNESSSYLFFEKKKPSLNLPWHSKFELQAEPKLN
jgi:hypothetical protein